MDRTLEVFPDDALPLKLYSARGVNCLQQLTDGQAIESMPLLQEDLQRERPSAKLLQLLTYVIVEAGLDLTSQTRGILHHAVQTAPSQSMQ